MKSLLEDLSSRKERLDEFESLSIRVLRYLTDVVSDTTSVQNQNYIISASRVDNSIKYLRPINTILFINEPGGLESKIENLHSIFHKLKNGERSFNTNDYKLIDSVVYTIQQSIGIGFDLVGTPNSARKHVGNRFEELIRVILSELGLAINKIVLKIPYESGNRNEIYRCETDIVISGTTIVKSTSEEIDPAELVVSLKTTTKDRMGKIFTDKILIERFLKHKIKLVGISLNDVQRKGKNKISSTFVPNLFMVYTNFLAKLEGYYYLDSPVKAKEEPFCNYISTFSKFIIEDIWKLLGS